MGKFFENKPRAFFVVGIIVVAVLATVGVVASLLTDKNEDVLAIIGGEKITREEFNEVASGLSLGADSDTSQIPAEVKQQMLDKLVETVVLEKKAKDLGIEVPQNEIAERAATLNKDYAKYNATQKGYIEKNARLELLREKVSEKILSWSAGKFIFARFDAHFNTEPTNLSPENRTKLAASDKVYAKKLIDDVYAKINSGQMTFEQGMTKVNSDPVIGKPIWEEWRVTWSQAYTKQDSIERLYPSSSPDFWDKIASAEVGKVSEPMVTKSLLEEGAVVGKGGDSVDGMYLIVKKESGQQGEATNYEDWLKAEKERLGLQIINNQL